MTGENPSSLVVAGSADEDSVSVQQVADELRRTARRAVHLYQQVQY